MLKSVGAKGLRCLKSVVPVQVSMSPSTSGVCRGTVGDFQDGPNQRTISTSFPPLLSYEGDGKTTITILNHEYDSPLMIDSYHKNGFTLNNGFSVYGPLALFPKTALGWDVSRSEFISPESLSLFGVLEPKLDILVIGKGDASDQVPQEAIQFLRKKKINFEILTTEHACSTFNFLNVEGRCVAAALIPPKQIKFTEEDTLRMKFDRERLYEEIDKKHRD